MAAANRVTVRAFGGFLDQLRSEASRIAKDGNIDWWVERTDKGVCFWFEGAEAKKAFVSICENFRVTHHD